MGKLSPSALVQTLADIFEERMGGTIGARGFIIMVALFFVVSNAFIFQSFLYSSHLGLMPFSAPSLHSHRPSPQPYRVYLITPLPVQGTARY